MDHGHRTLVIEVSSEALYCDVSTRHHVHEHALVAHRDAFAREPACKGPMGMPASLTGDI
jgi:hypothetical protein